MVGGNTFVRSTVTRLNMADSQLSIFRGHRSCRKARSARSTPHEMDRMRAMSKALQAEGVTGSKSDLLGHAGGIRRRCMNISYKLDLRAKGIWA